MREPVETSPALADAEMVNEKSVSPFKLWDTAGKIAKGLTRAVCSSFAHPQDDTPRYPRSDAGQDGDDEDEDEPPAVEEAAEPVVEVVIDVLPEDLPAPAPIRAATPPVLAPIGLSTIAPTPQRDSDESETDDDADTPAVAANVSGAVSDVYQQTPGEGSSSDDSGSSTDEDKAASPNKASSSRTLPNGSKPFPSGASKPVSAPVESGSDTEDEPAEAYTTAVDIPKPDASLSLPSLAAPRSALSRELTADSDADSSDDEVEMSDVGQSDEEERPSSRRDSSRYGRVGNVEYDSDEAEGITYPGGPSEAASEAEDEDAPKRARLQTPNFEPGQNSSVSQSTLSPIAAAVKASQRPLSSPVHEDEGEGDVTMLVPQEDEIEEDDDDLVSLSRRSPVSSVIGDFTSPTGPAQGVEDQVSNVDPEAVESPQDDALVIIAEDVPQSGLNETDAEEEEEPEVTSYQVPRTSLTELDEDVSASQIPSTYTGAERAARDANALDLNQASQKSQAVASSSQERQPSPAPVAEKAPPPAPAVRTTRVTRAGSAQAAASTPVSTRTTRSTRSQVAQSSQLAAESTSTPAAADKSIEPEASEGSQGDAEQPTTVAKKVRGRASVAATPSTPLRTSGRLSRKASAQPSQSQSQAATPPAAIEEEQGKDAAGPMDVDEAKEPGATPAVGNQSVSRRVSLGLRPRSVRRAD